MRIIDHEDFGLTIEADTEIDMECMRAAALLATAGDELARAIEKRPGAAFDPELRAALEKYEAEREMVRKRLAFNARTRIEKDRKPNTAIFPVFRRLPR